MDRGREAARHQDEIAGDRILAFDATVAVEPTDADARDAQPPLGAGDDGAGPHRNAGGAGLRRERTLGMGAQVDHRGDGDARRREIERSTVGPIVGGEDHRTGAGRTP